MNNNKSDFAQFAANGTKAQHREAQKGQGRAAVRNLTRDSIMRECIGIVRPPNIRAVKRHHGTVAIKLDDHGTTIFAVILGDEIHPSCRHQEIAIGGVNFITGRHIILDDVGSGEGGQSNLI